MSLAGRSRWSWAGLGLWLAKAGLAVLLAAGLLAGTELADDAWDRGVHVTPAQTTMHAALTAAGFAHHHMHGVVPAGQLPGSGGAVLQDQSSGMRWGTPFTPAAQPELAFCLALAGCPAAAAGHTLPAGVLMPPPTPPPQAA
ncbi:MAG TPA: hypothetical protein VK457_02865 [Chloroflexota bacterium]|nr:hypothetical protein [Chloroflexota bacterium]